MEITPRRSISLDLDKSIPSLAASSYPRNSGNRCASMYAAQAIKPTLDAKMPNAAVGMSSSLSADSSAKCTTQKRENFFTSMFGALTSIVVERLGKVPSTFMSNVHNTLSVTVVPNEGIISQDFFKNLTRSYEQLATEQEKDVIQNSSGMGDTYSDRSMYDVATPMSHVYTDDVKKLPLSSELSPRHDCDGENEFDEIKLSGSPVINIEIFDELNDRLLSEDSRGETMPTREEISTQMRDNGVKIERASACPSKISTNESNEGNMGRYDPCCASRSAVPKLTEAAEKMDDSSPTCASGWHTMWHRVVNGVSESFGTSRAVSPDSEVPTKKANLSKPLRRKTCTIARGRGKGRGKSQLRRNGVSQSRRRKERTKQNIYSNIQDDLNAWEDLEECPEGSDDEDSSINEQCSIDQPDAAASTIRDKIFPHPRCLTLLESLSFDVTTNTRKRKQTLRKTASNCPVRVKYVPESSMEVESHENNDCSTRLESYRPRLVSESSVDSEDSYCIVFENGSESEYTDYDYDEVTDEASDGHSDNEFDDDRKETLTVRFNPEPEIHTMIQWDYAYRAARRGPWEEMARDRERFHGRIHCIERILNPILSAQHRNCVWQERFNGHEQSGQTAQSHCLTKTQ